MRHAQIATIRCTAHGKEKSQRMSPVAPHQIPPAAELLLSSCLLRGLRLPGFDDATPSIPVVGTCPGALGIVDGTAILRRRLHARLPCLEKSRA
ncbi:hypothetical protein GUJ93_ZPchr0001g30467 [Zizania palustris]|uniref:Uncharacterized protein n=1 Tax=Zizania palustris TaxID=103762 RepID=A0A8J5S9D8_ZIZPA|nr:hypothetical protein GUJ93_ZPchr0001g30467 [Zizania palustris]